MLIAQKQSDTFSSSLTHRLCSTHLVVRLPKIGVVAEIFSPEGAEVFNKKFTQPRLQIARCRFFVLHSRRIFDTDTAIIS